MLQSPKINQIAIDTATDLCYHIDMKNNNTSTKRENRMINEVNRLHAEYKQVIENLWEMWDNADSDEIRKGIETNVQLMDSVINELLIYGVEGKPK